MNSTSAIIVTKASGEKAAFSTDKLRHSLERSGANIQTIDTIIDEVKKQLYDGITTQKIYQRAFSLLKKYSRIYAGRYNMKRAIMDLGPSGFPFEKYVAEILKSRGYATQVNQLVPGQCVTHEIDIIAEKDQVRCMIECKFHNSRGINCDVKIPLYIQSRFKDVEQAWIRSDKTNSTRNEGWLVTNTKFSVDAIQYGNCAGLKLLGWDFPRRGNLQEWIETSGLHPVTCLTTLTRSEKEQILAEGIVLCRSLPDHEQLLIRSGITGKRIKAILAESMGIIHPVDQDQTAS